MNPGRELDILVAEKVMGWKPSRATKESRIVMVPPKGDPNKWPVFVDHIPKYSTDIAAAWEVVEKIRHLRHYSDFHLTDYERSSISNEQGAYYALFVIDRSNNGGLHHAAGESLPHAICRAALKVFRGGDTHIGKLVLAKRVCDEYSEKIE